jgi:phosphatidylserine decarboxylase
VDGTISQSGEIVGGELLQAKDQNYSLKDLLAGQRFAERFEGGSFATIYLAPYNYHRIHMPRSGRVMETWYVPGKLFSVNRVTAQLVPRLFARNERVVCLFQAEFGQFAVVLVGALNVGSIATSWAGDVAPASTRKVTRLKDTPTTLVTGQELGRFNMGSTIILLFEPGHVRWQEDLRAGRTVRLGESIGSLR